MWKQIGTAFRLMLLFTVVTGLVYPLVVTGLCQILFRQRANGSLAMRDGKVVGSHLIAQNFQSPDYFHPRPSAAGDGYDPTASGPSNLGPTNQALVTRVDQAAAAFHKANPEAPAELPADLLTTSASGLDPDISPASAADQAARVAAARQVPVGAIRALVAKLIQQPQWGFLGEARVNVLDLNLALDQEFSRKAISR